MKIEVEIISKEMIKPSSPTPRHLRHHQLSFLDQLAPHAYIPFLYFYPLTNNTHATQTQISIHLKKSLSKILTHYYPLSGRVKDNRLIDCNDHGVPFYEARVKSHSLSDIATNPSLAELKYLLSFDAAEVTQVALGVQLNLFQCGGVATGLCLSHRMEIRCLVSLSSTIGLLLLVEMSSLTLIFCSLDFSAQERGRLQRAEEE